MDSSSLNKRSALSLHRHPPISTWGFDQLAYLLDDVSWAKWTRSSYSIEHSTLLRFRQSITATAPESANQSRRQHLLRHQQLLRRQRLLQLRLPYRHLLPRAQPQMAKLRLQPTGTATAKFTL